MKWTVVVVVLAGAAGCSGGSESSSTSSSGGEVGESCLRNSDCASGLSCVGLRCSASPPDAGGADGSRLGERGDSCLRSADCRTPLRCVAMTCSDPPDGGTTSASSSGGASSTGGSSGGTSTGSGASSSSSAAATSSSAASGASSSGSVGDGGVPDAGRREGCSDPGPTPRATGGCCLSNADCVSGLCIQGVCSATCAEDSHCAILAPASPLRADARLSCGAYPSSSGRACLPGSQQACADQACPGGESCTLGWTHEDGGLRPALRCSADRAKGAGVDGPCSTALDCREFHPGRDQCRQGACRAACDETHPCEDAECVAPPTPPSPDGGAAPSNVGQCEGPRCGDAPSGSDVLCNPGQICVPAPASSGGFVPRCGPMVSVRVPVGGACMLDEQCQNGLCLGGTCSALCQWDGDCPAARPFCTQEPRAWRGGQPEMAACDTADPAWQLCQRESECARAGCVFLDERSLFSTCLLAGESMPSDPVCGASRYCEDPERVCLPDPTGVARCTLRSPVGEPCTSSAQCLSATCVGPDGMLGPGETAAEGACSGRCLTTDDCGPSMTCRAVATVSVQTDTVAFDVLHPMCWPLHENAPCTQSDECAARVTGSVCDESTRACHLPGRVLGSACTSSAGCELGLTCSSRGSCVREGCVPGSSNSGCLTGEVCVETGPITGECRAACSTTSQCTALDPGLVCQDTDSDTMPDSCGRP